MLLQFKLPAVSDLCYYFKANIPFSSNFETEIYAFLDVTQQPTFWDNLSVPEKSETDYQSTPRNISEEIRSKLHRGRNLQ
jgi:hypothetical protein